MRHYIATNEGGNIVGKWIRHEPPVVPDNLSVQEVENVENHQLDYWYYEQS